MKQYSPKEIEAKWQNWWIENKTYVADLDSKKPKYMASGMFNYPSGDGIHVGHSYTFTIPDVLARFKRQRGYESLNPVGWDSFGLPAENYAIKMGISPQESMAGIIPNYRKQYTAMGWGVDWAKEIDSSQPIYYKWTQWIFSEMHRNGLVYQDSRMQWWCEQCQTVLANEQVDANGKCWRHDKAPDPVIEKKEVKQWFFKITEYADELLEGVDDLNWTEGVKLAQKNWIGRSIGAEIKFRIKDSDKNIDVFTTRPDTLFGATFLVLAPEHDLAKEVTQKENKTEVEEYIKLSTRKTEVERQASKDKTGVFTGSYAINPVSSETIPIWIADYVLGGYGTGAIMCVPSHDARDKEFALRYGLEVREVVDPVAVREDAKDKVTDTKKKKVVAVVSNGKNEVLTINWGNLGGRLFIGGTAEGDEDPETTALREVTEETGYNDLEVEEVGKETFFYKYYAFSKSETHEIETTFVKLKLNSESQQDQNLDESEKGNFSVEWISETDADRAITEPLHRYGYEKFILKQPYGGEGVLTNSAEFNGMSSSEAREKIVAKLNKEGLAEEKVNYKMRDWSVGRQRYWGAPIPIINCEKCGPVLVPDTDLPVVLPELDDFKPSGDGRSALARATEWLKVKCPECGGDAERETDTLDTFIDSSWYLYRYIDPFNEEKIFNSELINKWFPIDFYDGADHATAHLLYARFVGRFFSKIGLVDNPEPLGQMLYHGKILGSDGTNFSKSAGNGVDPLEVINSGYGADALRTYLMFAAPAGLDIRWDPNGVPGTYRFLNRVWNLVQEFLENSADIKSNEDKKELDPAIEKKILIVSHKATKKVTEDIENDKFNTAIATMMETVNSFFKIKEEEGGKIIDDKNGVWRSSLMRLLTTLAPFAPHITEELWHDLGIEETIHVDTWPSWDDKYLVSETIKIAVQVNGKLKSEIEVASDAEKEAVLETAKADKKVATAIGGQEIKKEIYVPGRIVNFVI